MLRARICDGDSYQHARPASAILPCSASDSSTGRLSLVVNQQIKDPVTGLQLTYFPVGQLPKMMALSGSCLFTLNSDGNQTVFPYSAGSNGQLTLTTNSVINSGATRATSIIAGGSAVYITDAGPANTNSPGQILPFTVGSYMLLNTIVGGATQKSLRRRTRCMRWSTARTVCMWQTSRRRTRQMPNSSLSAFNIQSNQTLQVLTDPQNNPYPIGGAPVCIVEDPSNQYIYTSNGDGTVTG